MCEVCYRPVREGLGEESRSVGFVSRCPGNRQRKLVIL